MAIYMKYGDIEGDVSTATHKGWSVLLSLNWGYETSDNLRGEMGLTSVREVRIVKEIDDASILLAERGLVSRKPDKVQFAFTTSGDTAVVEYLSVEIGQTLIKRYSLVAGAEGKPMEEIGMSFTTITLKHIAHSGLRGMPTPQSVSYSVKKPGAQ
jgi:type VI secretion system secreted protein Hcp